MIVFLWDAHSPAREGHGVTDDEETARQAAEAFLNTSEGTARVEQALLVLGIRALTSGYQRTGQGCTAQPRRNGPVRWVPLSDSPELAAS
jgi:hypothetical protein